MQHTLPHNQHEPMLHHSGAVSPREFLSTSSPKVSQPEYVKLGQTTFWDALGNYITGNLDYRRQIESAMRAEAHSAHEAEKARKFSASEAQKARAWSEYMSNTAYSRAIADLKTAGVNPYAIGLFGPASTPSASMGTAYAGASSTGSTPPTAKGISEILGFLETAYKEQMASSRQVLSSITSVFGLLR